MKNIKIVLNFYLLPSLLILLSNCEQKPARFFVNVDPAKKVIVGEEVSFRGVTSKWAAQQNLTYSWDFDWDFSDNNIQQDSIQPNSKYIYEKPGVYFARLEVTDEQENSDFDFFTIEALSDTSSGVQLIHNFEGGFGITQVQKNGSSFEFTLENTNSFFFRLDNCKNKPVRIKIFGYGPNRPCPKTMTIYADDYTFDTEGSHKDYLLVYNYNYAKPDWQHLKNAEYIYHSAEAAMEIRATFSESPVYLSWSASFLPSYLYRLFKKLENLQSHRLQIREIGKTVQRRSIKACLISDFNYLAKSKKTVIVHAGQHGYEHVHGWTLEGMIYYLLSENNINLKDFILKIVPQVNIDGAYLGLYRFNVNGKDLNRDEGADQPEMAAINSLEKESDNLLFYFKYHTHPPEMPPLLEYRRYGSRTNGLHENYVKKHLQPLLGYKVTYKDKYERYFYDRGHFGIVNGFRFLVECSNLYFAEDVPALPTNYQKVGEATVKAVFSFIEEKGNLIK